MIKKKTIDRLAYLERASLLSASEVAERAELRQLVGAELARCQDVVQKWATDDAISSRLGAVRPTVAELLTARRAQGFMRGFAKALSHPLYPNLGRDRMIRLIKDYRRMRPE